MKLVNISIHYEHDLQIAVVIYNGASVHVSTSTKYKAYRYAKYWAKRNGYAVID